MKLMEAHASRRLYRSFKGTVRTKMMRHHDHNAEPSLQSINPSAHATPMTPSAVDACRMQAELMSMFQEALRGGSVQVSKSEEDAVHLKAALGKALAGIGTGYRVVDRSGIANRLGSAHTVVAGARGVCTISADDAWAIFLAKVTAAVETAWRRGWRRSLTSRPRPCATSGPCACGSRRQSSSGAPRTLQGFLARPSTLAADIVASIRCDMSAQPAVATVALGGRRPPSTEADMTRKDWRKESSPPLEREAALRLQSTNQASDHPCLLPRPAAASRTTLASKTRCWSTLPLRRAAWPRHYCLSGTPHFVRSATRMSVCRE